MSEDRVEMNTGESDKRIPTDPATGDNPHDGNRTPNPTQDPRGNPKVGKAGSQVPTESQESEGETWHVVTTDSPTVYTWNDFKGESAMERARKFAEEIGHIADYHEAGSRDCEVWGCKT